LPVSSFHLRQAFVKAFFLDLDLYFENTKKIRLGLILAIKNRLNLKMRQRGEKKSLIHASKSLARNQSISGQERSPKPKASSIPKQVWNDWKPIMLSLKSWSKKI